MTKTVLIPLPHYGFDPTEAAVPWKVLTDAGYNVVFATPDGRPAAADERILTGRDFPSFVKKSLMAEPGAIAAYAKMTRSKEFSSPISYAAIDSGSYDALLLPGGHDKGMREYLESPILQQTVARFFAQNFPVGAICHGTLVVGRSRRPDGHSILWGRRTTGLTRPQEMIAYQLTRLWLGDYYRTYHQPLADELRGYLRSKTDFQRGPGFPIPVTRDSLDHPEIGFTVQDGNYISARWPGDAYRFALDFKKLLEASKGRAQ